MTADFRPANFALAALGIALATFMQVLDTTIANVSLPTIAGNLSASAQQGTWVITAFTVSNAIGVPLTGWLARRFGEVRLFMLATILFTVMSFLCGISRSLNMLIVCRALQGFVAGPLLPVAQSLMVSIFPANRRTVALSLISTVAVVAPIAGPILGGWITDDYSWPWIFFINVPIGVFACYVVWHQMRHKPEQQQRMKMDYVGLVSLVLGVGALQIVLDIGNDEDWFQSNTIIALSIISAISIAVFLIWELNEKEPVVNLRLFRHRNFAVGALGYTLAYGAFIGGGLLVPLWLQTQMGYTAFWAGLAAAPMGVLPILLAPMIGRYSYRFDLRMLGTAALLVFGVTFYMRSAFNLDVDFARVAWLQLIQGIGLALFFMPIVTITLSDLRNDEMADGAGLSNFMRMLGASFGISLTTYMWSHRAVVHHARLAETITPYDPATQQAIGTLGEGNAQMAMRHLDIVINQQAFQLAFNEIFRGLAFLLFALIVLVWIAKPPFFKGNQSIPVGDH